MSSSEFSNSVLKVVDWNFSSFGNDGLNSFHWYPATFISAIPGSLIPILSKENDVVLDTFCGTSVTGYESIRLGRNYIGIDNNPIAILISKAKLYFPNTDSLRQEFIDLSKEVFSFNTNRVNHPNREILKKWYHADTFSELNGLLMLIKKIEDPNLRICSQAIFSSIVKKASSQGKHWGWVCDNVQPKPEEIIYKNANDIFLKALNSFCDAVDETLEDIGNRLNVNDREELKKRSKIYCEDTISALADFKRNSIDLILTSPPYYGVADYVKAQRLSFLWFEESVLSVEGYSYDDFDNLRGKETGARSARHRKTSFIDYISYMKEYVDSCYRVLKKGGNLVLVVGDSKAREQTIELLGDYLIEKGFKKEYSFEREIKESKRRLMAKVKNEQLLVFLKI